MEIQSNGKVETALIIGGEWTPAAGDLQFEVRNPAQPEEVVGYAARAGASDVDLAMQAAQRAFPEWAALSYSQRAEFLKKVDTNLVADETDLNQRIRLFTREHGKVLKESGMEMTRLGSRFLLTASYAERLAADESLPGPPFDTIITRQPRGVALLIVPWNWPLSILGAKLPQALLAGNPVVIYLPYETPLAPALTIKKMADVLPPGVINLVTGPPSEIGDALVTHPLVKAIDFTGGVETGRHIMTMAAKNLTPVTLELGGNDPAIICEDAVMDADALQRMVMGTFLTTGQVCMALKRAYVHQSRYAEVLEGFMEMASRQVVGNGLDPEVTMGPLNNERQYRAVKDMIDEAKSSGAKVMEVGKIADQSLFHKGYFLRPAIVDNPDPSLKVVRLEQFGPVVPFIPFRSEDDAVRMANDSNFGLCSSVWTSDRERGIRIAKKLEAGYTYLNGHGALAQDGRAPFGGFKDSGVGRELGYEGILSFQESHSISAAQGWIF